MIKCVTFDFDGTLVNSNEIKRRGFFEIARYWDPSGEIVAEVIERYPSANRYQKTSKIAEKLVQKNLLPNEPSVEVWALQFANAYTLFCEQAIANCAEMPGASEALQSLSSLGLLLFVNSATPVDPLNRLLNLRRWGHFFTATYGAEATKADNLRKIASVSGTERHEIVHVGDQADDLYGAKEFGCHFVAMSCENKNITWEGTSLLVNDLRELPGLFARIFPETP